MTRGTLSSHNPAAAGPTAGDVRLDAEDRARDDWHRVVTVARPRATLARSCQLLTPPTSPLNFPFVEWKATSSTEAFGCSIVSRGDVMSAIIFPNDEAQRYDDIVHALTGPVTVEVRTSLGESFDLPAELREVIVEASRYFARDKAVSVTPHSRTRFI